MYVYMHICMYMYTHKHVCIYAYMHVHVYTQTHPHSHNLFFVQVPVKLSSSKQPSIYRAGGLSSKQARELVGKDWFMADKQMLSEYDSGIDGRLSSSEARQQLDAIYGDTDAEMGSH
jgi:hypothetical protein